MNVLQILAMGFLLITGSNVTSDNVASGVNDDNHTSIEIQPLRDPGKVTV